MAPIHIPDARLKTWLAGGCHWLGLDASDVQLSRSVAKSIWDQWARRD